MECWHVLWTIRHLIEFPWYYSRLLLWLFDVQLFWRESNPVYYIDSAHTICCWSAKDGLVDVGIWHSSTGCLYQIRTINGWRMLILLDLRMGWRYSEICIWCHYSDHSLSVVWFPEDNCRRMGLTGTLDIWDTRRFVHNFLCRRGSLLQSSMYTNWLWAIT